MRELEYVMWTVEKVRHLSGVDFAFPFSIFAARMLVQLALASLHHERSAVPCSHHWLKRSVNNFRRGQSTE
jgi:hypothetical protein